MYERSRQQRRCDGRRKQSNVLVLWPARYMWTESRVVMDALVEAEEVIVAGKVDEMPLKLTSGAGRFAYRYRNW